MPVGPGGPLVSRARPSRRKICGKIPGHPRQARTGARNDEGGEAAILCRESPPPAPAGERHLYVFDSFFCPKMKSGLFLTTT